MEKPLGEAPGAFFVAGSVLDKQVSPRCGSFADHSTAARSNVAELDLFNQSVEGKLSELCGCKTVIDFSLDYKILYQYYNFRF
jgi:hypothetical protein